MNQIEYKKSFKKMTIEKLFRRKIEDWLKSFPAEQASLVEKLRSNVIITGGAIASCLQGDMPNDYDLYIKNIDVAIELAKYYTLKIPTTRNDMTMRPEVTHTPDSVTINIKSAGAAGEEIDLDQYRYFEYQDKDGIDASVYLSEKTKNSNTGKYTVLLITSNAITLSDDMQIILRFVGEPEIIHVNYDFIHTTNYWTNKTGLILNLPAIEATITKELIYSGSRYPICSLFRIRKFIKRGWTIKASEVFKIAWDINKLNLNDIDVLQDQLTGVDAAYFHEVISILKNEHHEGKILDRTYLFGLLDKVFRETEDINIKNLTD